MHTGLPAAALLHRRFDSTPQAVPAVFREITMSALREWAAASGGGAHKAVKVGWKMLVDRAGGELAGWPLGIARDEAAVQDTTIL